MIESRTFLEWIWVKICGCDLLVSRCDLLVKHILCYVQGISDTGLLYSYESKLELINYADAEFLFDLHKARSQTGYLFIYDGTTISWHSTKQTMAIISPNHVEIIIIHEASWECFD